MAVGLVLSTATSRGVQARRGGSSDASASRSMDVGNLVQVELQWPTGRTDRLLVLLGNLVERWRIHRVQIRTPRARRQPQLLSLSAMQNDGLGWKSCIQCHSSAGAESNVAISSEVLARFAALFSRLHRWNARLAASAIAHQQQRRHAQEHATDASVAQHEDIAHHGYSLKPAPSLAALPQFARSRRSHARRARSRGVRPFTS